MVPTHCLRMRCRAILLKADDLSSATTGEQADMSLVSVNVWVKRFLSEDVTGSYTCPDRSRKPVMDFSDDEAVRVTIRQDRQSLSKAISAWQEATGKAAGNLTFNRFLSILAQDNDV